MTAQLFASRPTAQEVDAELDISRFGADSMALLRLTVQDPEVLALMEKVLVHNFTRQFGVQGRSFVRSCFDDFAALPGDAGIDDVRQTFQRARNLFTGSGFHYSSPKSDYAMLQLQLASPYFNGTILDVGANDNSLGQRLLALKPTLHRVIGTDIEQRAGVRTGQHLDFLVQPGPSLLPIEDHRVDTVVLKHALHHMTFGDQEEILRECGRCLAHDGHIVICEDTYSTVGPPLHDSGGFHRDMLRLVDSARIRLLLASFDIWPQTYKDKDMPIPGRL